MLPIHNINLTGHKKVHAEYDSWSSWRHESSFCLIEISLVIKFIFDNKSYLTIILRDVSTNAIIQRQIWWTLPHLK